MTLYRYKAINAEGVLKCGFNEALSSAELKSQLRNQGLSLITYSRNVPVFFSRKVPLRRLMELCLHLKQFDNAGISLKDALEELTTVSESVKLRQILKIVISDIEGGLILSEALSKHPSIFDAVFVGMISVGEKTGRLPFVLEHLFQHLKWRDETQTLTFKALRYPLIMGLVLILVIGILMTVLVPELIVFIQKFSDELPLSTRILIGISNFLSENTGLILCFFGGLFLMMPVLMKANREGVDHILNKSLVIGPLRKKINLLKFFHVFTILFESGIDILTALKLSRKTFSPGIMSYALLTIEKNIHEGLSLSQAFENSNIFPKMVLQMIRMGEQTSTLTQALHHTKDYLDITLKRQIEMVVGLIEPTLILCVGAMLAWIIYALFLPLYDTLSLMEY